MRKVQFTLLAMTAGALSSSRPDTATIVRRSAEANEADWKAAPQYDYFERDRTGSGTSTYRVMMIRGSPYQELIAVNGKPLSVWDQEREQHKLEGVISHRNAESFSQRSERIAAYERDRKRDFLLMQELTHAFDFKLVGEQRLGTYEVYVLRATPRSGYRPPNIECEVLTGMKGKLWIDKETYQWVKVEAGVVHPVSIAGFLARVQPGTHFELDKMPIADDLWLPKHFSMKSNTKVLFLFRHMTQEDESYFNYQRAATHY